MSSFKSKKNIYNDDALFGSSSEDSLISLSKFKSLIFILILTVILSLAYFKYRYRSTSNKNHISETKQFHYEKAANQETVPFNELEFSLIKKIHLLSIQKGSMTIDEINKTLGLSSKNLAVQKKNRNEIINRINTKWQVYSNNKEELIQKQRSTFDKRNFEYFITDIVSNDPLMSKMLNEN